MLNELRTLERSLAAHGEVSVAHHPDLSQLLKGDVVRVRLGPNGRIDRLDPLLAKTRHDVWTLRDGKHNGFPGLKIVWKEKAGSKQVDVGLLQLGHADRADHEGRWKAAAKSPAAKRAEIARLGAAFSVRPDAGDWPKPGHRRRIAERLEELRPLEADPLARSIPAAFERFLQALDGEPSFAELLFEKLLERARDGEPEWLEPVRAALLDGMALAIDVDDSFPRDAGDPRQIAALSAGATVDASTGGAFACALSGASARLLDGNFPQPTLPSLGQTDLFARNKDSPALARYRRNGASSLPVDSELVGRLSGAASKVTEPGRRGRTWRLLPAEFGDKQDLLLAFVAADLDRGLTGALGDEGEADEDAATLSDMEHAAAAMLGRFDAIRSDVRDPAEARILVLRTVDPANRKAIFDRRTDVNRLFDHAEGWIVAMRNTPHWLALPVFAKDGKKLVRGRALPQAPLSLTALSRKLYVRGGREAFDAPGLPASEGLALFMQEGAPGRRARRVLKFLLDRHHGLLAGLAHASRRDALPDFDKRGTARRDGLRSAAWLGALLHFAGRTKETYMDDTGFKIGQLLAAADAIHVGYCFDVRGGQIPPTLVGNSVFATAGRDPDQALGVLATRWKPYHAWAVRAARGRPDGMPEKGDARGWAVVRALSQLRLAGQLCEDLQHRLAIMREQRHVLDEAFRAELLLGYLAGVKPEPKADNKTAPEEKNAS